jgi:hypothetical protein
MGGGPTRRAARLRFGICKKSFHQTEIQIAIVAAAVNTWFAQARGLGILAILDWTMTFKSGRMPAISSAFW